MRRGQHRQDHFRCGRKFHAPVAERRRRRRRAVPRDAGCRGAAERALRVAVGRRDTRQRARHRRRRDEPRHADRHQLLYRQPQRRRRGRRRLQHPVPVPGGAAAALGPAGAAVPDRAVRPRRFGEREHRRAGRDRRRPILRRDEAAAGALQPATGPGCHGRRLGGRHRRQCPVRHRIPRHPHPGRRRGGGGTGNDRRATDEGVLLPDVPEDRRFRPRPRLQTVPRRCSVSAAARRHLLRLLARHTPHLVERGTGHGDGRQGPAA